MGYSPSCGLISPCRPLISLVTHCRSIYISILDGLSIFPRSCFFFSLFIWGFILDTMIGFPRPYYSLFLIIIHYFLFFSHMLTMYWMVCQFSRDLISPYYFPVYISVLDNDLFIRNFISLLFSLFSRI